MLLVVFFDERKTAAATTTAVALRVHRPCPVKGVTRRTGVVVLPLDLPPGPNVRCVARPANLLEQGLEIRIRMLVSPPQQMEVVVTEFMLDDGLEVFLLFHLGIKIQVMIFQVVATARRLQACVPHRLVGEGPIEGGQGYRFHLLLEGSLHWGTQARLKALAFFGWRCVLRRHAF